MAKGDKAVKEAENRARHLKTVNEAKARRRNEPVLERKEADKDDLPELLIVCEGRNTEPSYFEQFKLVTAKIVVVGRGNNTLALVNHAKQLNDQNTYQEVWCVFDRDSFPIGNFNNAIKMAEASGFKVAYSNQSFEYWLILHFDDHQGGGMHRDDYHDKLNELLEPRGASYEGEASKKVTEDIFDLLLEIVDESRQRTRMDIAIDRAERIYNRYDHTNPAAEESSTTVFKLARELKKHMH